MNIILIGYRGTGKSSIGQRLAEALELHYVGLDAEIVKYAAKSIPEIVEDDGWEKFRDIESEIVKKSAMRNQCVLDTGGGAILRAENVALLKRSGRVFWLQASVADIVDRIGADNQRPSLTGEQSFTDEVEEVLAQRTPLYAAAADHAIDTSGRSFDEIVQAIIDLAR